MKSKVKLFIFGVETFIVFFIASVMIFTRIYNGSYFSVFHQFDKQEHLILKKKISDHDFIVVFERGEPVLFEKNHQYLLRFLKSFLFLLLKSYHHLKI